MWKHGVSQHMKKMTAKLETREGVMEVPAYEVRPGLIVHRGCGESFGDLWFLSTILTGRCLTPFPFTRRKDALAALSMSERRNGKPDWTRDREALAKDDQVQRFIAYLSELPQYL